jgi:hypothetical protein
MKIRSRRARCVGFVKSRGMAMVVVVTMVRVSDDDDDDERGGENGEEEQSVNEDLVLLDAWCESFDDTLIHTIMSTSSRTKLKAHPQQSLSL